MKGRIPIFGILIILVGLSFAPLNQGINIREYYKPISFRGILYVGGIGPNNYTRIQYAIDDASNGDTVFVYDDNSPYYENVIVNKTINLIGEDRDSTVIDADSTADAVYITVDWVNISGFTLTNSGSNQYDCGIDLQADHTNIVDNKIISNNYYGMCLRGSNYNNIIGNFISENDDRGIDVRYNSDYNIISGNNINKDSIVIDNGCENNTISENICHSGGLGISMGGWNIILNNTIFDNNIFVDGDYNIIAGNTIYPNEEYYGIEMWRSDYALVYNNVIMNGVVCWGIRCCMESYHNVITNNDIINNEVGIFVDYYTDNNIITYNNLISNSDYGIKIADSNRPSENNTIYHNNFIDNTWNGYDVCDNYWYNTSLNEGNYWDDYDGNDSNGDGIGDIPYTTAGLGIDYYPLMNPWGEQRPVANYTYFEEYSGYVFNASLSYDRDGEVISYEWDFGDGTTDSGMVVSHAFNDSGEYDVTLIVTDDEGYKGNITKTIDAVKNYPPDTPTIDGPDSGGWGKPYHFTFQSSDNEGSEIWYYIDWGDEHNTGWMGPFASGEEISDAHTWTQQETFTIRCKAKDMYDIHSDWAEFEITIPRTRASTYHRLLEYFQLLERLISLVL
jgi:nitrous oxidase accessory protein